MDNCDCLCHSCHQFFESRPLEYAAWYGARGTDPVDLERRGNEMWDKDYGAVLDILIPALAAARAAL